jgi:hypothetical protein
MRFGKMKVSTVIWVLALVSLAYGLSQEQQWKKFKVNQSKNFESKLHFPNFLTGGI